jgi:FkbM family methyltransferase
MIRAILERLGVIKYRLVRDNYLVHKDELYKVWEEAHLRKLLERYQVDCIFDVGADLGQYAEMLRKMVGYRGLIISFEPNPDTYAVLREKAIRDPKWVVENLALAAADGSQIFNIMSGSQFSSLCTPRHAEVNLFAQSNRISRSVNVRTETLTTAFERLQREHNFARPFLKLDTQGFDVEIVRHGRAVLANFVGLQSELAIKRIYEEAIDFREAITSYEELGFVLSAFVPNNQGHFPLLVETDCIMVRKELI